MTAANARNLKGCSPPQNYSADNWQVYGVGKPGLSTRARHNLNWIQLRGRESLPNAEPWPIPTINDNHVPGHFSTSTSAGLPTILNEHWKVYGQIRQICSTRNPPALLFEFPETRPMTAPIRS